MDITIIPSTVNGSYHAPPSKSAMQRACAASLIKHTTCVLENIGTSNDDKVAMDIIVKCGAHICQQGNTIRINSNGIAPQGNKIDCGESGLSIRLFTPLLALSTQPLIINGAGSLLKRPMNFFSEILPQLGVSVQANQGKIPLHIQGALQPKNITIDGSLSSQFLTGMLMAYSAGNAQDVTITVQTLQSKPYIDLTLDIMQAFGLAVPFHDNYKTFYFPKNSTTDFTTPVCYVVEGDWSSAAFFLVAAAITQTLTVKGLRLHSSQADKAILTALKDCGAVVLATEESIVIAPNSLQAFTFDATDCPDLFPPLVALAAHCKGTSVIVGTQRLIHKESNRAITLQQEFEKMGIAITLDNNAMLVQGGTIQGTQVSSRNDHRIAMACAIAALKANGNTNIVDAEAIQKSYPNFFIDLKKLGVTMA